MFEIEAEGAVKKTQKSFEWLVSIDKRGTTKCTLVSLQLWVKSEVELNTTVSLASLGFTFGFD